MRSGQVTDHQLRTRYRAVFRNVYLANELPLTALQRARAAWLFAGPDVVLAGRSAAAIHGTKWLDDNAPAEIIRADRHTSALSRIRMRSQTTTCAYGRACESPLLRAPRSTSDDDVPRATRCPCSTR